MFGNLLLKVLLISSKFFFHFSFGLYNKGHFLAAKTQLNKS